METSLLQSRGLPVQMAAEKAPKAVSVESTCKKRKDGAPGRDKEPLEGLMCVRKGIKRVQDERLRSHRTYYYNSGGMEALHGRVRI